MSEQPSSAASQQTTESAGDMLRSARERKGLSIEQAAAHLNLRPSLVTDLESEHYEQLRIPTYRRGYLRAYARLLEIDPEQVLKAHDERHGNKTEEPIKVSTPIKPIKRPSKLGKIAFWIITIAIILLIVGLTTQWWKSRNGNDFNQQDDTPSIQQAPNQSSQSGAINGNGNSSNAGQPATSDNPTAADANNNGSTGSNSGNATNVNASDNTSTPANNATGNSNTAANNSGSNDANNNESSNDLQMNVGNGVDGANMTTSEAASRSNQQTPPDNSTGTTSTASQNTNGAGTANTQANTDNTAANSNGITLHFNEQSWTRITDASGHTVLTGLQQAGSQQTVTGQPPFRLTVGNASGVSITYQGQPVNLASQTARSNVARITLGN